MLDWCSTTWAEPPILFAPAILEVQSCFFAQASLDCDSPVLHFLHRWDDRHVLPCPAFFFWDESHTLFCLDWPGTMTSYLSLLSSLGWQVCMSLSPAIGWDGGWGRPLDLCLNWPQTLILPISASQVAKNSLLRYHSYLPFSRTLHKGWLNSIEYTLRIYYVFLKPHPDL
jgi:hypothetical protein